MNSLSDDLSRREVLGAAMGTGALASLGLMASASPAQARTSPTRARLDARMRPLLASRDVGFYVFDWYSRTSWGYRATKPYSLGSCVKVVTAISLARAARRARRGLDATERSMIVRALTVSDNAAESWMWAHSGGQAGFQETARALGLSAGTSPAWGRGWGRSYSTPRDMVTVVGHLVGPSTAPLDLGDARFIANVMATSRGDQIWGVGAPGRTAGRTLQVKDGWVPLDGVWRINSVGHVYEPRARISYTAAILSSGWRSMTTGFVNQVGAELYAAMRLGPLR